MGVIRREMARLICARLRMPAGPHRSDWQRIRRESQRYFAARQEAAFWASYIADGENMAAACEDAYIEQRTGYNYRDAILVHAALLATDAGILDPRSGQEM